MTDSPFGIASMTGFGIARGRLGTNADAPEIDVTLRSVNHRYFKCTLRTPEPLAVFEREIEAALRDEIKRGAVTCSIDWVKATTPNELKIDVARLSALAGQLDEVAASLKLARPTLDSLLALPGVVQLEKPKLLSPDDALPHLLGVVRQAATQMAAMRRVEGAALAKDLSARLALLTDWTRRCGEQSTVAIDEYRQRLSDRLNDVLKAAGAERLAPAELAREVTLFAERTDIAEELTRLKHHITQFGAALKKRDEVGRKLDFVAQEMLREANTIGSKCQDSSISSWVIDIKTEIERIKEQIQNVE